MIWKLAILVVILFGGLAYFLFHHSAVINLPSANVIKQSLSVKPSSSPSSFSAVSPTIDQIFSNNHSWVATLSAEKVRTVLATGDIIPARSVNYEVLAHQDFKWPYLKTADVTSQADITFVNLETPLIDQCPTTQQGMVFCGDQRNVDGLVFAGVDVASLANNHAGNWGVKGVAETSQDLTSHGIAVTGTDSANITIKTVRGLKFAFLGYDDITTPQPGVSNADTDRIKKEVSLARTEADVVIVTYHWGIEYTDYPDERQLYLGHLTIDAGADLVIGNHPHWVQPIEFYKGKLITYAHGNFVFDQMWSQKTREGVVGRYTFYDNKLIDVEYLPLQINDYGQPFFITDSAQKQSILDGMKDKSVQLSKGGDFDRR